MSETDSTTPDTPQWKEPETGPGVTIRDGYDFEFILTPLRRIFGKAS